MRLTGLLRPLIAVCTSLASPGVLAVHEPLWEFGVGVAVMELPDYRGSDEYRSYVLPFPYVLYRAERLRIDREGVRGLLARSERLRLELSVNAAVPVRSDKSEARRGMEDLDPTVEFGPGLEYLLLREGSHTWKLELPLRAVIETDLRHTATHGWVFNPHLAYARRLPDIGGPTRLSVSFGPQFGSNAFHDFIYRVEPQYATPTRPAYDPPGGYSGASVLVFVGHYLNHKLFVGGFLRYDTLTKAAFRDSPLVKDGETFMAGIVVNRVFTHSRRPAQHGE